MKVLKNFIGIDISKLYFDAAFLSAQNMSQVIHRQFDQSLKGFADFEKWLSSLEVRLDEQTLVCMENTGIYCTGLINYLSATKALVWVEMPIKIKKATGFERSCNDKTDAIKIAWYAFRYQDKKQILQPSHTAIQRIKHLLAQRDRLIESRSALKVPINELKAVGCIKEAAQMEKLQNAVITTIQKSIKDIEAAISKLILKHPVLCNKVNKITTIKGVGKITAITLMVNTQGFDSFDNAKQLACYCGVVPFIKKQSGSSLKSKPRVSYFSNKKLKRLLHLCALSAIKYDNEIKSYYGRKKQEGKNTMSIINAVRNKLVLRMFAILRDNREFVENYQRKCA
jgi:transposase